MRRVASCRLFLPRKITLPFIQHVASFLHNETRCEITQKSWLQKKPTYTTSQPFTTARSDADYFVIDESNVVDTTHLK